MIARIPRSFIPVVLLSAVVAAQTRKVFDVASWRWWFIGISMFCAVAALLSAKLPRLLRIALSIASVFVATAVIIRAADGTIPSDMIEAFTKGAGQILSSRWPSPVIASSVGFIALLSAITGVASAQLSLQRVMGPAQLLPPVALLGAVALFASQAGAPSIRFLTACIALTIVILWCAARDRQDVDDEVIHSTPERQPQRAIVLASVALLTLPFVFSGVLSSPSRYDPRDQRNDAVKEEEDLSPLTVVDQLRTRSPETVLFESSGTPVGRWRLVALNRYDGLAWMAPGNLRQASTRLVDQGSVANAPGVRTVNVTIRDLEGQWLPSPAGRTFEISVPVRTDDAVSSLLSNKPLVNGLTYRVVANELSASGSRTGGTVADRTLLANMINFQIPVSIRTLATQVTALATNDRDRAEMLATFLRENFQLDEQAPAGHSAGLLELFLTKSKRGRREQFVAAYALLAASVGLPVRLAVGFLPATTSSQVTSSSAIAWPEVAFEGIGWLTFDPAPATEGKPAKGATAQAPNAQVQTPTPTTTPPVESTSPSAPLPNITPSSPISKTKVLIIGLPLIFLVGVIAYVLGILDLKKRQWDRRAAATTTNGKVVGAFLNGTDRIMDLGVQLPPSGTDRELILVGASKLDAAAELAPLADMATEAAYGSRVMDDSEVEDAHRYLRAFEIATASIPRKELLKARLSLRSLRRGLGPRRGIKHSGK